MDQLTAKDVGRTFREFLDEGGQGGRLQLSMSNKQVPAPGTRAR